MSNFARWNEASLQQSVPRRKDVGQSLAVDILRGRKPLQHDYSAGYLVEPADTTALKPMPQMPVSPNYTGLNYRRPALHSSGETTVLSAPYHKKINTFAGAEDSYRSHSYQKRPNTIGWLNSPEGDCWSFQSTTVYENPTLKPLGPAFAMNMETKSSETTPKPATFNNTANGPVLINTLSNQRDKFSFLKQECVSYCPNNAWIDFTLVRINSKCLNSN